MIISDSMWKITPRGIRQLLNVAVIKNVHVCTHRPNSIKQNKIRTHRAQPCKHTASCVVSSGPTRSAKRQIVYTITFEHTCILTYPLEYNYQLSPMKNQIIIIVTSTLVCTIVGCMQGFRMQGKLKQHLEAKKYNLSFCNSILSTEQNIYHYSPVLHPNK